MASAPQSGQSGDSGKRQALIGVNDLNYVLPPDLSVSVVRTHTNHYFQQSEYTDKQRAICILNTGAHYIDTRQSSLEFGVRLSDGVTVEDGDIFGHFGKNGSALNLIDSITVTSRAGDELCRLDQADLLHYCTIPYRNTQGWCDTVGQGMGLSMTVNRSRQDENTQRFSIPLYALVDFFNYGRLLPPMIASGLRISITWTAPARAFIYKPASDVASVAAGAEILGYTIENPYISTFAHQLSDGIQRDLNELSATNGLEIVYTDWEPTEISYNTATDLSAQLEVRKAASRALQAIAVTRTTGNLNIGRADSYGTSAFDYAKYQWQLGSLYFPQQPVIANGTIGPFGNNDTRNAAALAEAYKHTLISFGTYKPEGGSQTSSATKFRSNDTFQTDVSALTGNDSTSEANSWAQVPTTRKGVLREVFSEFGHWGTFSNGMSVIGVQLERTDLFNMSGVPINNARVLSLRTTYRSNSTAQRTLTVFLKYVRLARCFLNNVEVEQ